MCCKTAIESAYKSLRESGVSAAKARSIGLVIFKFHHPDVEPVEARNLVRAWTGDIALH